MVRVFLAEEDEGARKAIRDGIRWSEEGFALVGEAGDGVNALVMILDLCPDIVVVGRSLPFYSGVKLLWAVHRRIPWARLILISGDDNGSGTLRGELPADAQRLVKPVNIYDLTEALQQARRQMADAIPSLDDFMCLPQKRDVIFAEKAVLTDGLKARILKICPEKASDRWTDGMLSLLERSPSRLDGIQPVRLPGNVPGLMVCAEDDERLEERTYGSADTVARVLGRLMGVRIGARVSPVIRDADGLRAVLDGLEDAAFDPQRPILGPGDAMRPCPGVRPPMNPMGEWLLCAREEELPATLDTCARAGLLSPVRMAAAARQLAEEAGIQTAEEWHPGQDRREIQDQLVHAIRLARESAPWLASSPLSLARRRLSIRFRDVGLLINHVARECGLGVERFRVVFAQEMGMTYTEYLRRMRVSGAKTLLTDTRMRISSVARAVGYTDPGAFFFLFQHYVGMSPQDFRKQRKAPNPQ